ncbi:hypothetical protein HanIR_Chr12g0565161 [Helianthus annuus]|nr:hypothetical protein HanIR_Chr12g0565161 [Helianthus annuus]
MDVMKSSSSDLGVLQRKMSSFSDTLLAAQISVASVVMMVLQAGFLLQYAHTLQNLTGNDQWFLISELYKKSTTEPEAIDEDDDDDDEEDDDDDDEDGEEEEDDDEDEDDEEQPPAKKRK